MTDERRKGPRPGEPPARERTVLGLGVVPPKATPPSRERSVQEPPPEGWDVPDVHDAATKETVVPQIVVQVGAAGDEAPRLDLASDREPPPAPGPEASIALDLVARKKAHVEPAVRVADVPLSEASLAAAGVPRRRRGGWLMLFLLMIAVTASRAIRDARQGPVGADGRPDVDAPQLTDGSRQRTCRSTPSPRMKEAWWAFARSRASSRRGACVPQASVEPVVMWAPPRPRRRSSARRRPRPGESWARVSRAAR